MVVFCNRFLLDFLLAFTRIFFTFRCPKNLNVLNLKVKAEKKVMVFQMTVVLVVIVIKVIGKDEMLIHLGLHLIR